jgi:hypothetical protein
LLMCLWRASFSRLRKLKQILVSRVLRLSLRTNRWNCTSWSILEHWQLLIWMCSSSLRSWRVFQNWYDRSNQLRLRMLTTWVRWRRILEHRHLLLRLPRRRLQRILSMGCCYLWLRLLELGRCLRELLSWTVLGHNWLWMQMQGQWNLYWKPVLQLRHMLLWMQLPFTSRSSWKRRLMVLYWSLRLG